MDSQSAKLKYMSSSRHEGLKSAMEFRTEDTVDKVVIGQFCFRHSCAVNIIAVVGEDEIQYVVVF